MSSIAASPAAVPANSRTRVLLASLIGTTIEFYDFYVYATAAVLVFPHLFFPAGNETTALLSSFAVFGAAMVARPLGAIFFGHLGDRRGRKVTLVGALLTMGIATFLIGALPTYAMVGWFAPALLVILRLAQGFALGGEWSGAALVATENAPKGKRAVFGTFPQLGAPIGFIIANGLFLIIAAVLPSDDPSRPSLAFLDWGWRIPFLVSAILLAISVWIRMRLNESPAFLKMKEEGKESKAPIKESFGEWGNLKIVILALLGLTAGQAVVWYTGQFYALFFLTKTLGIDANTANIMIALALLIGTPFFIVFGALSDRIGRKPIIMAGCLLAAITYFPTFKAITHYANPTLEQAQASAPVTVIADPATCSFQFNPVGTASFTSSCDVIKAFMAGNSVNYANEAAPAGTVASARIGKDVFQSFEGKSMSKAEFAAKSAELRKALTEAIRSHGYPAKADPSQINYVMVVLLLTFLVILVTMVYGPIAAMLVEMFPTRIRYTSMSLPYHIGNGWFGGFLPPVAFAVVAATGNIYDGLWYPIIVAAMSLVIGTLFIRESKDNDIHA